VHVCGDGGWGVGVWVGGYEWVHMCMSTCGSGVSAYTCTSVNLSVHIVYDDLHSWSQCHIINKCGQCTHSQRLLKLYVLPHSQDV